MIFRMCCRLLYVIMPCGNKMVVKGTISRWRSLVFSLCVLVDYLVPGTWYEVLNTVVVPLCTAAYLILGVVTSGLRVT